LWRFSSLSNNLFVCVVSLQDIEEVRFGQHTPVFDRNKKTNPSLASLDSLSLSVIFGKFGTKQTHTHKTFSEPDIEFSSWSCQMKTFNTVLNDPNA
jgi:hypothetical protein